MEYLIGRRFGRVVVIEETLERSHNSIVWKVRCDCGKEAKIASRDLLNYPRRGCGNCGDTKHPLYSTWIGMIRRCTVQSDASYKDYGGRGITVCKEWQKDFLTFVRDMGNKPSSLYSLDRINNELGYSKENCRWALPSEQAWNTRSTKLSDSMLFDIITSSKTNLELAKKHNLSEKSIYNIKTLNYGDQTTLSLGKLFNAKEPSQKKSVRFAITKYLMNNKNK